MSNRFHVIDPHCSVAGGEDFGAVETREEAEKIVADRIAAGDEGGCRCGRGYVIQSCEDRIKVDLGWRERQADDMRLMEAGLLNLHAYRAKDGLKRELTPDEIATHKCYNYQPKRFHEMMHENSYIKSLYKKVSESSDESAQ